MTLFGGDNDVTLTIKAKDEASSGINGVLGSVGKLAGGFALGQAAVSAFTGTMSFLKNEFVSTIASFSEAEKANAQTEAVLKSTGYAAGITAQQVQDLASSLESQTTFADESIQAAENLLLTFTNIKEVFPEATKTVLDMSQALGQDLKSSSVQLGKALQDPIQGVSALQRVGVNFTDAQQKVITRLVETGHAAEAQKLILAELNKEFGGSAAAAAETFSGKVLQAQNRLDNFKELIGGGVTPVLGNLITTISNVASNMVGTADVTQVAFNAFRNFTEGAFATVNVLIQLGSGLAAAGVEVAKFADKLNFLNGNRDKEYDKQLTAIGTFANGSTAALEGFVAMNIKAGDSLKKMSDDTEKAAKGGAANLGNFGTAAKKTAKDITDSYSKLSESLTKVRQTGADELASLAKSHETNINTSMDRIKDLRKSLADLNTSYNQTGAEAAKAFAQQQGEDAKNIGEQIVAQQQKIADLKKAAGVETDPQKKINLMDQLKAEQEAYAENAAFIDSMNIEVIEAKRRAGLTDFERAIEDYKARRELAVSEYNENRANAAAEFAAKAAEIKLQQQQELKKIADEHTRYSTAQAAITKVLEDAETLRLNTTKKTADQIVKMVDLQIEKYNRLADAIARASQGKAAQLSIATAPISREHGGIVPGAVGEAVPILAHGQERIIPAGSKGGAEGGGSYSIVINNPVVRNNEDLNAMRQMVEDAFRDVSRVHKLTTI